MQRFPAITSTDGRRSVSRALGRRSVSRALGTIHACLVLPRAWYSRAIGRHITSRMQGMPPPHPLSERACASPAEKRYPPRQLSATMVLSVSHALARGPRCPRAAPALVSATRFVFDWGVSVRFGISWIWARAAPTTKRAALGDAGADDSSGSGVRCMRSDEPPRKPVSTSPSVPVRGLPLPRLLIPPDLGGGVHVCVCRMWGSRTRTSGRRLRKTRSCSSPLRASTASTGTGGTALVPAEHQHDGADAQRDAQ